MSAQAAMAPEMVCWVVYKNPIDMSGCWVARKHILIRGQKEFTPTEAHMASNVGYHDLMGMLESEIVKHALCRFPRAANDEPHIVECWM